LVMKNLQNYTDLAIIQPGVAVLALLTTRVSTLKSSIGQFSMVKSLYLHIR